MTTSFDQLRAFYQSAGWPMEQVAGNTILSTTYAGELANWVFVASSDERTNTITLFARAPFSCPRDRYDTMSELLERANFGMTHGAWVMDRTDGEIRFRVGTDLSGIKLTDEHLRQLTLYTNYTMNHYLPSLQAVIEKGYSAAAAYALAFPSAPPSST